MEDGEGEGERGREGGRERERERENFGVLTPDTTKWVSTVRKSLPWVSRDILCFKRFFFSSFSTIFFVLLDTVLPEAPGLMD